MKHPAPMRRTARFGAQFRAVMDREQKLEAREAGYANMMEIRRAAPESARGVIERVMGAAPAMPKDDPVRSEAYRRLVALRPCKNCGKHGRSQAAHLPPDGKAIKQDDRLTFPLCAEEPGALGCHAKYDRYKLFPREVAMQRGEEWAAQTRAEIKADGAWPKNLPEWSER